MRSPIPVIQEAKPESSAKCCIQRVKPVKGLPADSRLHGSMASADVVKHWMVEMSQNDDPEYLKGKLFV